MNVIEAFLGLEGQWLWFILAALLAIIEIIVPGIFLVFIAMAAALTGLATLLIDISLPAQLILFAISSLIAVYGGKHWYNQQDVESSDPMLNNRSARMVGKTVTVVEPVDANGGRVRVGDGEWPARGPKMQPGEKARIAAVVGGIVEIEAID
ncbi:NfeD family protein [Sphingorhabdus arenilitoris]|uniref:NfeD family protein n=1 Tax=Sphingorhabdus arenilitoris TaxID=1490041 RepID=A0ABV8RF84_9SPHN